MRLEIASAAAIKYACTYFHYMKRVPSSMVAFSVFNASGDWAGVIIYALGASRRLAGSVGFAQGQVFELVRVALNGKQESTGKAIAISLRLLKRHAPLCKAVVSFADPDQGHKGVIYQATNWIYLGKMKNQVEYLLDGKPRHGRSIGSKIGSVKGLKTVPISGKHKYVYPLQPETRRIFEKMKRPFPK